MTTELNLLAPKILEAIDRHSTIVIVCHKNPDGDTLGAGTAMFEFLKTEKRKNVKLFCLSSPPEAFNFLTHYYDISNNENLLTINQPDLIISLDSSSLGYAGVADFLNPSEENVFLVNIDHHLTNENFGDINCVVKGASSTCEVVYHLFKRWNVEFNKDIATSLLCGILTDTMNFSNAATTTEAIEAASFLLEKGANLRKIMSHVLYSRPISTLKLWGRALSALKLHPKWKSAVTVITKNDVEECGAGNQQIEGVANFLTMIDDIKAIMVLKEEEDFIKGSLRTTRDDVDVAKIAKKLGGGGHKKAAGFSIKGSLIKRNGHWQVV